MKKKEDLPTNLIPIGIWPRVFSGIFDLIPIAILYAIVFFTLSHSGLSDLFSAYTGEPELSQRLDGLRYTAVVWLVYVLYYAGYEAMTGASWGLKAQNGIIIMQSGEPASDKILTWRYLLYSPLSLVYVACLFLKPDTALNFISAPWVSFIFWINSLYIFIDFIIWYRSECHFHIVDIVFNTVIVQRSLIQLPNATSNAEPSLAKESTTTKNISPKFKPPDISKDISTLHQSANPTNLKDITPLSPYIGNATNSSVHTNTLSPTSSSISTGVQPDEELLNRIYAAVSAEILSDKFDQPLMLRADVESSGDEKIRMRIYTKLRVEKYLNNKK
jgi:hypothetical protein